MRTKRLAALLALALALSGCSGEGAAPASATAPAPTAAASAAAVGSSQSPAATPAPPASTPSPAPVATASPAAPSPSAAGLATTYLALAGKGDAAILACDAAQVAASKDQTQSQLTRAKAAARACLAAYDTYAAGLRATTWGAVQPQADAVKSAMGTIQSLLEQMAGAKTAATFRAAYNRVPAATTALRKAANALRAVLGLPPA